jgi:hypothetical protein
MAIALERSQVGKREDYADIIANVDVKATPFVTMVPKGRELTNSLFKWQADNEPAVALGGFVDGTDISTYENYNAGRAELTIYGQMYAEGFGVSDLSEDLSNVAGLRSEIGMQVLKALRKFKRQQELTALSAQETQADNGTVPYLTRGLGAWIASGAQAVLPVPASFRTPAGSISAATTATHTEAVVRGLLKSVWDQTGNIRDYDCIVGSALKDAFTNLLAPTASGTNAYARTVTVNRDAATNAIISDVDVFKADFGSLRLHVSNFMPDTFKGYIVPMDLVELRYGIMPKVEDLPRNGPTKKKFLSAFWGLCVKNPLAFGKFNYAS